MSQGNVHVNLSGGNWELARQPTPSGERGFNKYGAAGLLASSATRGWSNLAAELRSHSGMVAWNNPQPDAEICVDMGGSRSVITRRLDGFIDSTVSERGTIWFRPAGVQEGLIDMSEPVPAILHLYLPHSLFLSDNLGEGLHTTAINSLRHEGSFRDPLLAEIAYAIMFELSQCRRHSRPQPQGLPCPIRASVPARLVGVNLAGFFHLTQRAAARMLLAGSGHIVNSRLGPPFCFVPSRQRPRSIARPCGMRG